MTQNEIPISPDHLPQLARLQHLLEWFQNERARLGSELRYVMTQGQNTNSQLAAMLQQHYGLDPQHDPVTVDVEKGVILTPMTTKTPTEPQ